MVADLTLFQIVVTVVVVLAGSVAQSTLGIGFGIVMVPVLALVAPDLLPAMPLILTSVLCFAMIARERGHIDMRGLPALMLGRIAGTVLAAWVLTVLTGAALEVVFGVVIVVVVLASIGRPAIRPSGATRLMAGAVSGLFATTAAIGGPPVAVLYQGRPGPEVRSTLAVLAGIGGLFSLLGLIPAGRITWGHLVFGAFLLIPTAVGFTISGPLGRFLEGEMLRPGILIFAGTGGLLAIVRGFTG